MWVRLFAVVVIAFKGWMLIDAMRRRAAERWLWVIPFMPGGAVVYFFAVKLQDPGMQLMARRMLDGLKRPPSLYELERRYQRTPSIENRVLLAQGLFDEERFEDALSHFEGVLQSRAGDADGLYGVGRCKLALGHGDAAIEPLERLIELNAGYREYAAWSYLAGALWQSGDRQACHELTAELVRKSPRLRHMVMRARYLIRDGKHAEARELLGEGLEEHDESPRHVRRLNRPWARAARKLMRSATPAR